MLDGEKTLDQKDLIFSKAGFVLTKDESEVVFDGGTSQPNPEREREGSDLGREWGAKEKPSFHIRKRRLFRLMSQ